MTDLEWISSVLSGAILIVGGWFLAQLVAIPIHKFCVLRTEVIGKLASHKSVLALYNEPPYGSIKDPEKITESQTKWLQDAQVTFRGLASRMRSFSKNEDIAVWIIRLHGYDPPGASGALFGVSNVLYKYGDERHAQKQALAKALRLKDEF
jgi:hypothetical protein